MKIAIEGCAHGELEKIYDTIALIEKRENYKVDLLLCCGDFQSTRNVDDLNCMAIPKKFHDMCSFYKYYSGEKVAPILTIFIGGNHEASNYLQELPYGGWVAPNIYYLGYAGVVNVNGIRIAGISGIYKGFDFYKGHYEFAPYDDNTKRSVYHVRQLEVFRLKQITTPVDICLSHDWPRGVYNFGNADQLVRFKPHFRDEINANKLGSPPCESILHHMKPKYWFSAHLHCKFSAVIPHEGTELTTKFLALDKCLPKRRFLQVLDMDGGGGVATTDKIQLSYDLEWLAILCNTKHLISVKNSTDYMPGPGSPYRWIFTPTDEEKQLVQSKMPADLIVPINTFVRTAEPYRPMAEHRGGGGGGSKNQQQPHAQLNPQTTDFCHQLDIDDPLALAMLMSGKELNHSTYTDNSAADQSLLNDDDGESSFNTSSEMTPLKMRRSEFVLPLPQNESNTSAVTNPDELSIGADDDDDDADFVVERCSLICDTSSGLDSTMSNSFLTFSPPEYKEKNDKSLTDDVVARLTNAVNIESPPTKATKKSDDEVVTNATAAAADDEQVSPPKKFKRRNQAIYGAED